MFDGALDVGFATVAADGTWSGALGLNGQGEHVFTARDTDAAGNVGTSNSVTLTLNTSRPQVRITSPGGLTNQPHQTVQGTGEAGGVVKLVDADTREALGEAPVAADGSWSADIALAGEGAHAVEADEANDFGNVGTDLKVYILDTLAPTVAIVNFGPTNKKNLVVRGVGEAGTTVSLYANGASAGSAVVAADGSWSAPVALNADGDYVFTATDTDAAGNIGSSAPATFTLDTLPPAVTLDALPQVTNQASRTLTGTGEAGTQVTVYDYDFNIRNGVALGSAVVGDDGRWSLGVALAGEYTHCLRASDADAAGNVGVGNVRSVLLDTQAPMVTIANLGGPITQYSNVVLTGRSSENGFVDVYADGAFVGKAPVQLDFSWSLPELSRGSARIPSSQAKPISPATSDTAIKSTLPRCRRRRARSCSITKPWARPWTRTGYWP